MVTYFGRNSEGNSCGLFDGGPEESHSQCPSRTLSEYQSEALPVEPSYLLVVHVVTNNNDSNFVRYCTL